MENNLKELLVFLTPLLFIANLVQSLFYLPAAAKVEGKVSMPRVLYYALLFVFFAAMMFSILTPSLLLMWVAIELTTLVSAPLIAYHSTKDSLEAMWKYLLICSIGIAFALFGTMLVLYAQSTESAKWYMAGFAFILAGYGTKMGLSPFHTWLPDAHSEAPAPVSALLSGALLNCSFFAIVRFREIMPDGASLFCDLAMLFLGLLSVAVGAVFMVRQTDYKRLLAYSSVEHIGLITVLYSLYSTSASQKLVMAAILLHIAAHSLTKTMLFQLAGNLLLAFQTRAISVVQGLGEVMKKEAALWVSGFILICGMPPSALFLSELGLVFSAPIYVSVIVLVLLFVVFAAMMKAALNMTMGRPLAHYNKLPKRLIIVPGILFVMIVAGGTIASAYILISGCVK